MKSFHNKQSVKDKYVNRMKAHMKADELVQGIGYENGKGCAVGCTLDDYSHSQYPVELGLPEWIAHLEDKIFEGLNEKDAKKFPLKFLQAIPVGVGEEQFENLRHKIGITRMKALLKQQKSLFPNDDFGVNAAIELTIKYHKNPTESAARSARSAAESAARSARSARSADESAARSARSARSADESAARSAAESAARSARSARSADESAAESAAESAYWSAYWSARSAAESAAESAYWSAEADRLIRDLKKLSN